jgi:hypothetical protein
VVLSRRLRAQRLDKWRGIGGQKTKIRTNRIVAKLVEKKVVLRMVYSLTGSPVSIVIRCTGRSSFSDEAIA